jgi:hypothetical protein
LEKWNLAQIKERVTSIIEKNVERARYWVDKTRLEGLMGVDVVGKFDELEHVKEQVVSLIDEKIKNSSVCVDKHVIHRINAQKD